MCLAMVAAPRVIPLGGGGVWVAIFPTTQIVGPSVRPHPVVKEPGFTVPLRYSWKYVGVRSFRYGRVRRTVISRVEPPHVRELKSQTNPSKKVGKKKVKRVVEDDSSSDSIYIVVMGSLFLWPKR